MIWYRNNNHFGDCLLQLGILKAIKERYDAEIGFIVNSTLQFEACFSADFLSGLLMDQKENNPPAVVDFVAIEEDRAAGVRLIDMWAKSPKYNLTGMELKPYINLTAEDRFEAHRLRGGLEKKYLSPFAATCLWEKELDDGQRHFATDPKYREHCLIGSRNDPAWMNFDVLMGYPIRTVAALLEDADELVCIGNGIANLAWAVGCPCIKEWVTPLRAWAKVPYSERINP
jgi:hypothetical protein